MSTDSDRSVSDRRADRRLFLRASAGTAAAGLVPWTIAQDADDPIVTGEGEFRYEVHHDWLRPPRGHHFGDTHGLAQDAAGRIYVAHTVHPSATVRNAVCVYDRRGRFLASFGEAFAGGAHGLDLRDEDGVEYLYHCDTRRRLVVKTTLDGTVIWERGWPVESGRYPNPGRYCPTNVAFLPDGDLVVGDGYGSSYLHRLGANGDYRGTWCEPGKGEGQVSCPHGLWVDDRGGTPQLMVADRSNRRVQRLSLDGEHLGFATEGMRLPCHFKVRDGLALCPDLESCVVLMDEDDRVVARLGDGHPSKLRGAARSAFVPGRFVHPHDAIFLENGDILVAEWVPIGRVTLLKRI